MSVNSGCLMDWIVLGSDGLDVASIRPSPPGICLGLASVLLANWAFDPRLYKRSAWCVAFYSGGASGCGGLGRR